MRFFRILMAFCMVFACSARLVADEKAMLAPLQAVVPDLEVTSVEPTPVSGIYKVEIEAGPTLYMSEDGRHFFQGDFIEIGEGELVNLGEKAAEEDRAATLAKLSSDDMIVFGPEKPAATVHVFTDVDCYYCRKLHQEVPELTKLGVEVRYLAYPRAGIGSASYKKIASAWCADDPNAALTAVKAGEEIEENVCDANPVRQHFELGGEMGVRGTPALVTETGRLLPGYMPAAKLASELGL